MPSDDLLHEARDHFPTFRRLRRCIGSGAFWRRTLRRTAFGILAFASLGYLSNLFSANSCERDTRAFLTDFYAYSEVRQALVWSTRPQLTDFYAKPPDAFLPIQPPWTWRSKLVGLHLYFPPDATPSPWAFAFSARPRFPFLVTVNYGCLARDLYGEAGVRIYLAFFRWHILLAHWPMWFS
jgi:hypothetical protein